MSNPLQFGGIAIAVGLATAAICLMVPRAVAAPEAALTPQTINAAVLAAVPAEYVPAAAEARTYGPPTTATRGWPAIEPTRKARPDPAVARLEVLLDRVGASPGVIDGFDGENLRKAVSAVEIMLGGQPDGRLSAPLLKAVDQPGDVIGVYTITAEDVAAIVPAIPSDYGEMAKLKLLGYTSVVEELGERFHMDVGFLKALNADAQFVEGEKIFAAITGPDRQGEVSRIEADKTMRQVRAYDAAGHLLAAYPATIGSTSTPSPSGTHTVLAVVRNPTYSYNPDLNFKQGNNDKPLTLPPGPNGPVGSVWIDLSEPTYGIHGTPEPSLIDKASSHGCVRLTNWDAEELAGMVKKGVTVDFVS